MKKTLFFFIVVSLIVSCKKTIDEPSAPLPPIPPAPKVPIVETYPVTDVTLFSITLNGKLIDTVGSKVTETGLVADTLPSPTTTKNVNKFIKTADGSGNFSVIVTNIPSNKKWYVRAYAISAQGIGYGKEETFNSLPEKVYVGDAILTNQQEVNSFGANNYT